MNPRRYLSFLSLTFGLKFALSSEPEELRGKGRQYSRRVASDMVDVTVFIIFDDFPLETSWAIFSNVTEDPVASVPFGYYGAFVDNVSVVVSLMAGEDYVFVIEDAYGDGLCCNTPGLYKVIQGNSELLSENFPDGFSESTTFTTLKSTATPTFLPTSKPTPVPTADPTPAPIKFPTLDPSSAPTKAPVPTLAPTPTSTTTPVSTPTTVAPAPIPTTVPSIPPVTTAPATVSPVLSIPTVTTAPTTIAPVLSIPPVTTAPTTVAPVLSTPPVTTAPTTGSPVPSIPPVTTAPIVEVSIFIIFDDFPMEIGWAISRVATEEIVSFIPIGHYSPLDENVTEVVELIPGEAYVFVIEDDFGDGLCCRNAGSYVVTQGNTELVSGGDDFGTEEVTPFTTLI